MGVLLNDSTTKKIIVLILSILFILPLFTVNEVNSGPILALKTLQQFNMDSSYSSTDRQFAVDTVLELFGTQLKSSYFDSTSTSYLIYLEMSPSYTEPIVYDASKFRLLRSKAITSYELTETVNGVTYEVIAKFDDNKLYRDSAFISICTIIFIGGLLVIASGVFSSDIQSVVLTPIENMINMIDLICTDPLAKLEFDMGQGDYETILLMGTVEKITSLLRVGMGEAGSAIIIHNLGTNRATSEITTMLPGARVYVIVGFCDIHLFEEVNWRYYYYHYY